MSFDSDFSSGSTSRKKKLPEMLWQQQQENSPLCDVSIIVQGQRIPAHWCVLMVCPYFESLYSSGMKEMLSGNIDLSISTPEVVEGVLRFIYTSYIKFNLETLDDYLKVADYLQLEEVKDQASMFLTESLVTVENCVKLCTLSSLYGMELVYNNAQGFLYRYFDKVVEKDEILTISMETLSDFILDDKLGFVSQRRFFDLIVRWIDYEAEKRHELFEDLFCLLNLDNLSQEDVNFVKDNKLVKESKKCQKHLSDFDKKVKAGIVDPSDVYREVIVFTGVRAARRQFAFLTKEKKWVRLPYLTSTHQPGGRDYCMSVIDSQIMMIKHEYARTFNVIRFNAEAAKWESNSSLCMYACLGFWTFKPVAAVTCAGELCFLNGTADCFKFIHLDFHDTTNLHRDIPLHRLDCIAVVQLHMFAVQDKYVFIILKGFDMNLAGITGPKDVIKCLCINLKKNPPHIADYSDGAQFGEIVHVEGQKIFLLNIGKRHCHMFNLANKRWSSARKSLPKLPGGKQCRSAVSCVNHEDVYLFGGNAPYSHSSPRSAAKISTPEPVTDSHGPRSAYKFTRATETWEELPDCPMEFSNSAKATVIKLPKKILTCPPDCFHCKISEPFIQGDDSDITKQFDDESDYEESYYDSDNSSYLWPYGDSDDDDPYLYNNNDCAMQ